MSRLSWARAGRLLRALAAAAALVSGSSRTGFAESVVGSGTTGPNRLIVQNGFGFWAVINSNVPKISYSADGINWSAPADIFSAGAEANIVSAADMYYVAKTSTVYIAAPPTASAAGDNGYIVRGELTGPGIPTFDEGPISFSCTINGRITISRGDGQHSLTVTEDASGNPMSVWWVIDGNRNSGGRDFTLVVKASPGSAGVPPSRQTCNGRDEGGTSRANHPVVTQLNAAGDVVVLYKFPRSGSIRWYAYSVAPANSNINKSVATMTPNSEFPNNTARTASAITAPNMTKHFTLIDGNGALRWGRAVGGTASAGTAAFASNPAWTWVVIEAAGAVPLQNPSIGLSDYTTAGDSGSAYIVYKGNGDILNYATGTTLDSAPSWAVTTPWLNVDDLGSWMPSITQTNAAPIPPRVVFSSATQTEVHFETIFTSPPPVLTSISDSDGAPTSGGIGSGYDGRATRLVTVTGTGMTDFLNGPTL
ncbi:MAG: hypothetical protein COV48_12005, partial [Elusimicrobia bacterium CG11_big_fil_rev_8_21_14_0_20_64_6]